MQDLQPHVLHDGKLHDKISNPQPHPHPQVVIGLIVDAQFTVGNAGQDGASLTHGGAFKLFCTAPLTMHNWRVSTRDCTIALSTTPWVGKVTGTQDACGRHVVAAG